MYAQSEQVVCRQCARMDVLVCMQYSLIDSYVVAVAFFSAEPQEKVAVYIPAVGHLVCVAATKEAKWFIFRALSRANNCSLGCSVLNTNRLAGSHN